MGGRMQGIVRRAARQGGSERGSGCSSIRFVFLFFEMDGVFGSCIFCVPFGWLVTTQRSDSRHSETCSETRRQRERFRLQFNSFCISILRDGWCVWQLYFLCSIWLVGCNTKVRFNSARRQRERFRLQFNSFVFLFFEMEWCVWEMLHQLIHQSQSKC